MRISISNSTTLTLMILLREKILELESPSLMMISQVKLHSKIKKPSKLWPLRVKLKLKLSERTVLTEL